MDRAGGGKRVLIIRPSALGDVCRTVPVLASIRAAEPDAHIDWVVQDGYVDAVAAHPALDDVVLFHRHRFGGVLRHPGRLPELVRWLADVRSRRYDVVIDCQGLVRSALIAAATRAPVRVGMRSARELAWTAYTHRVEVRQHAHTVGRMLALLEPLGIEPVADMTLHAPGTATAWWRGRLEARNWPAGDYAVLAPTSRWASKRWPAASWSALVPALLDRGFGGIVIVGAPSERAEVEPILADLRSSGLEEHVEPLLAESTIGRTMAVIAGAGVLVANDSAPLHMAVGLDVPCVGLFGPTDPRAVGPYGRPEAVVRRVAPEEAARIGYRDRGLGDRLMRRIAIADVLERIDAVLDPVAPAAGPAWRAAVVADSVAPAASIAKGHPA